MKLLALRRSAPRGINAHNTNILYLLVALIVASINRRNPKKYSHSDGKDRKRRPLVTYTHCKIT